MSYSLQYLGRLKYITFNILRGGEYKLSIGGEVIERYRGERTREDGFMGNGYFTSITNPFIICDSDEQCDDNVPCTVDTCEKGRCNNICDPFGPAKVGYCDLSGGRNGREFDRINVGYFASSGECLSACYNYVQNMNSISGCQHLKFIKTCYIYLHGSYMEGYKEGTCWLKDTSVSPSSSTKPSVSSINLSQSPSQSPQSEQLPLAKLVLPGRSCHYYILGFFESVEECAAYARNYIFCASDYYSANFIKYSSQYPLLLQCGCCYGTCPLDPVEFYADSNYDIYEYRSCSTTDQPSSLPSLLLPTDKPSSMISETPTSTRQIKCAKEYQKSKACGASKGRSSCCSGLVCHKYQTWRCVKGKVNTKCAFSYSLFIKLSPYTNSI